MSPEQSVNLIKNERKRNPKKHKSIQDKIGVSEEEFARLMELQKRDDEEYKKIPGNCQVFCGHF